MRGCLMLWCGVAFRRFDLNCLATGLLGDPLSSSNIINFYFTGGSGHNLSRALRKWSVRLDADDGSRCWKK
jgi:hypothetical protein